MTWCAHLKSIPLQGMAEISWGFKGSWTTSRAWDVRHIFCSSLCLGKSHWAAMPQDIVHDIFGIFLVDPFLTTWRSEGTRWVANGFFKGPMISSASGNLDFTDFPERVRAPGGAPELPGHCLGTGMSDVLWPISGDAPTGIFHLPVWIMHPGSASPFVAVCGRSVPFSSVFFFFFPAPWGFENRQMVSHLNIQQGPLYFRTFAHVPMHTHLRSPTFNPGSAQKSTLTAKCPGSTSTISAHRQDDASKDYPTQAPGNLIAILRLFKILIPSIPEWGLWLSLVWSYSFFRFVLCTVSRLHHILYVL